MISGVVALVAGEALLTGSLPIGGWAAFVFALNHAWFQVYEEPGLRERFGAEFDAYCRHVPRWIPRITPWSPDLEPEG
jgi:protein-S-isoprenylcysteine O-methyltransferase Ste14